MIMSQSFLFYLDSSGNWLRNTGIMRASTDVTCKLDGRHVCSVWAAPVKLDPDMHVILFLFRGRGGRRWVSPNMA